MMQPERVFYYFEELSKIPHPSYQEKQISDYCVKFARDHDLYVRQDDLGNVIIKKPATAGYEDQEGIIIQGHLDMVTEKENDCDIDMEKEGLRLKVTGDYLEAEGTTLGGDDGIAIAMALAILESDAIAHPPLTAMFTVSEEVGMEGAAGITTEDVDAHILLNLDSEEEGTFLAGCAGGCRETIELPIRREERSGILYEIKVDGLIGGHSGVMIHKGRANANVLVGRILLSLTDPEEGLQELGLVSAAGGKKDNVITNGAVAKVIIAKEETDRFEKLVTLVGNQIRAEFSTADPEIRISFRREGEARMQVLDDTALRKSILLLNLMPNGVQAMSADVEGLVETSLNMGYMKVAEEKMVLRFAVRSSVGTAKEHLCTKLEYLAYQVGAESIREGDYPAWEYRKDSPLRDKMIRIYREMYGKDPVVEAIHAGVECGLLAGKIADLDAVSMGPDILDIHTPKERLSISSTQRTWEYILAVLKDKASVR